jgi:hypothetical protein
MQVAVTKWPMRGLRNSERTAVAATKTPALVAGGNPFHARCAPRLPDGRKEIGDLHTFISAADALLTFALRNSLPTPQPRPTLLAIV